VPAGLSFLSVLARFVALLSTLLLSEVGLSADYWLLITQNLINYVVIPPTGSSENSKPLSIQVIL
jgi:hypothetical protein